MPTFTLYEPSNEKELHQIIIENLDSLETGLTLLKHELFIGHGFPDILCVDSGGSLVIIEVKLKKDENVLFQALKYYASVFQNRYMISQAFENKKINPIETPRLVIISKDISDEIRKIGTFLTPDVELFEWKTLKDMQGNVGITYFRIANPEIDDSALIVPTYSDHFGYITDKKLAKFFDKIRTELIDINLHESVTKSYLGYQVNGRNISWLKRKRKSFEFGAREVDETGKKIEEVRWIFEEEDDYSDIIKLIKKSINNLKKIS